MNGEVISDFDTLETGTKVSLSTVNGRVSLTLPSDVNATLKAESLNGNISNGYGLPVRKGKYVGRDLYGRVGSGDVQVRLESVNGDLSISRKSDGRNVNPAVDMLPQKGRDDEDMDDSDNESRVNRAKINREVARDVARANADAAA